MSDFIFVLNNSSFYRCVIVIIYEIKQLKHDSKEIFREDSFKNQNKIVNAYSTVKYFSLNVSEIHHHRINYMAEILNISYAATLTTYIATGSHLFIAYSKIFP